MGWGERRGEEEREGRSVSEGLVGEERRQKRVERRVRVGRR